MRGKRLCGTPECELSALNLRDPVVRWKLDGAGLRRLGRDGMRGQIRGAFESLGRVSGVQGVEVGSLRQADLVVRVATIDGQKGVLADSMYPGPRVQVQRYDEAEEWTVQPWAGVPEDLVDFRRVALHEMLHIMGMGHVPESVRSIMRPVYSTDVWDLCRPEILWLRRHYGLPRS